MTMIGKKEASGTLSLHTGSSPMSSTLTDQYWSLVGLSLYPEVRLELMLVVLLNRERRQFVWTSG